MSNFFREDLKLENRWWHRLCKIIFYLFLIIVFLFIFSISSPGRLVIEKKEYVKVTSTIDDKKISSFDKTGRFTIDSLKSGKEILVGTCRGVKKGSIIEKDEVSSVYDTAELYCNPDWTKSNMKELQKHFNNATFISRSDGTVFDNINDAYNYIHIFDKTCFFQTNYFDNQYGNWLVNVPLHDDNMLKYCFYSPAYKSNHQEYVLYGLKRVWCGIQALFWCCVVGGVLLLIYYKVIIYIICGSPKKIARNSR